MHRPGRLVAAVVAAGTFAGACGHSTNPQLPNPAAKYCVEQGGTVRIVTASDGSQSGICRLPDGTEVDEWDYYRQHHPAESTTSA